MSAEHEQQQSRRSSEQSEQPSDEPWADLELTLPHGRSPTGIVSLVELTHEDVGAEFVSTSVAGVKRTQFIAVDDVGQRFKKRSTSVSAGTKRQSAVKRFVRSWLTDSRGRHWAVVWISMAPLAPPTNSR
jgi:hypothetical protein